MLICQCYLLLVHDSGCNVGAGSLDCCAALSQHAIMTLEIGVTSRRFKMLYKPNKVKDTQEQCRVQVNSDWLHHQMALPRTGPP